MNYSYIQIYKRNSPTAWTQLETVESFDGVATLIEHIAHQYGVGDYRIDFCDVDGRLRKRRVSVAGLPPPNAEPLPKIHVYRIRDGYKIEFIKAYPKETSFSTIADDLARYFDLDTLFYVDSDEEIYNVAKNIHRGILSKLSYKL